MNIDPNTPDLEGVETVHFDAHGINCIAFRMFGNLGVNLRSCIMTLGPGPHAIELTKMPEGTPELAGKFRVAFNNLWFDTDEDSALKLQELFQRADKTQIAQKVK